MARSACFNGAPSSDEEQRIEGEPPKLIALSLQWSPVL